MKASLRRWLLVAVCVALVVSHALPSVLAQAAAEPDAPAEVDDDIASRPVVTQNPLAARGAASRFPTGAQVAIITLDGVVFPYTHDSLTRRIKEAKADGAGLIVLELNTPGGDLAAALSISQMLKNEPTPTVAWVNTQAYSAGTIIAAACDGIVVAKSSAMGDAAPISMLRDLAPTERAKALSPLLEDFRDSASLNGYNYAVLHAMAVLGIELYIIEHPDTGEQMIVNEADYEFLVNGVEDTSALSVLDARLKQQLPEDVLPRDLGEMSLDVGMQRTHQLGQWRLIRQFHNGETLLTLNAERAQEVGLAQDIIRDRQELETYLAAASVTVYDETFMQSLAIWLTTPWIKAILIIGLMIGLYVELLSPGLGMGGAVALLALGLLVIPPFMIDLASIWHLILILAGIVLVVVEIFVTPGMGVPGVTGMICLLIGLVLIGTPDSSSSMPNPAVQDAMRNSIIAVVLGIIVGIAAITAITKYAGTSQLMKTIILTNVQAPVTSKGQGRYTAIDGDSAVGEGKIKVGDEGKTISPLRPAGEVLFEGLPIDVVTPGEWIPTGTAVRVIEVTGSRIVVEATNPQAAEPPAHPTPEQNT